MDEERERLEKEIQEEVAPAPERTRRALVFFTIVLIFLGGFIALAVLASTHAYFPIDLFITRTVQTFRPPWFIELMVVVSWAGYFPQAPVVAAALILGIVIAGFYWEASMSIAILVVVEVLDNGIKLLVARPRPSPDLVHVVKALSSYSFPSGHVMYYTGFFGFLWFLSFVVLKRSWLRAFFLVIFGALVLLVGISRIYLGEHWSSDVLGAYLLGGISLAVAIRVYHWGKPRFFTGQPAAPPDEEE